MHISFQIRLGNNKVVNVRWNTEMFSFAIVSVLAVALLATSGDVTQTWTSPTYPKLYSNDTSENPLGEPITPDEDAWIGSLLNVGAMIGALPAGFIADRIGRKMTLLCIAIPHLVAYVAYAFARNVYLFYFGRFISGLSVGSGYAIIPMYVAEVSSDSNRNAFSAMLPIFWTLGNFLPFAIGPYITIKIFNLILAALPATFLVVFILLAPETPYYYIQKGNEKKAESSLVKLRSIPSAEVQKEILQIKETVGKHEDGALMDIFIKPSLRRALILSLILMMGNQFSGINAVGYYLEPILDASGTDIPSDLASTFYGGWLFISSFTSTFAVKKLGQKIPLIASCIGSAISMVSLGIFFYIHDNNEEDAKPLFWLPLVSLLVYCAFFNLGLAGIPWAVGSQLFPNSVKPISSAAVSCMCWFCSFLITHFFNDLTNSLDKSGTFWLFGGCNVLTAIFTLVWIPETKGKSFSEIQDMLQGRN
ncbi:facilitated trehalose transporter Tret1-like [Cylas formicarius]|uniref:facilitated trehalose transporter Tret1-like n=1 Tax=Cylas formicarius TaxID=197179 RepID=UPI0029588F85|nr:facilitated trehalose transporter Tret1-like [Cylas formicarius]